MYAYASYIDQKKTHWTTVEPCNKLHTLIDQTINYRLPDVRACARGKVKKETVIKYVGEREHMLCACSNAI